MMLIGVGVSWENCPADDARRASWEADSGARSSLAMMEWHPADFNDHGGR